ncbi:MAG: EAL domain-containing protein, partial [Proteobacteria bacterium]|nr:EAL domain-containing protein [Pseudomonadota bacterium]
QPILSVAGRRVRDLEALMRWRHPTLGMAPPDFFIPVAESDPATIDALTLWSVKTAAKQSGDLTLEGYNTVIAVNISGVSLRALDFPDRVEEAIAESGAPADGISFEVTETTAMQNPDQVADILTRLRLKGFGLALDDFGSGYSSLKVLRQMPFSALKIDQSFIHDILVSTESMAIVKSVVHLARSLNVESIAEGVETKEIAERVMALGVTGIQGYYLSPPLPLHEMAAWLKGWNMQAKSGHGSDPGSA